MGMVGKQKARPRTTQSKEEVVWAMLSVRCLLCGQVGFTYRVQGAAAALDFFLALLCPLQLLPPQPWDLIPIWIFITNSTSVSDPVPALRVFCLGV